MNNHKTIHHTSVQIILNYSIFDWARLASRFVTFTTAKKNSIRQQYYQQTYTSILSFVLEISKTVFWHVSLRKMDLFGRSISKRNPLKREHTMDGEHFVLLKSVHLPQVPLMIGWIIPTQSNLFTSNGSVLLLVHV